MRACLTQDTYRIDDDIDTHQSRYPSVRRDINVEVAGDGPRRPRTTDSRYNFVPRRPQRDDDVLTNKSFRASKEYAQISAQLIREECLLKLQTSLAKLPMLLRLDQSQRFNSDLGLTLTASLIVSQNSLP